jgi:carboxypeptidase Q
MSRRFAICTAVVFGFAHLTGSGASASDPTAVGLRERALESDLAWELVSSLTTEVGPRLAGSAGDRRAVAWGIATLERLGFDEVRTEPVTVPHWDRGEAEGQILAPFPQPLHLTALGGSIGTAEEGLEAEVVELRSVAELGQATEEQLRGKIVFLSQAMERRTDGSGYREAVPNRGAGASLAAAKGAVGLLIRSVGTGTHRFPHTGSLRYADSAPRIPAAALAVPDAELLQRQVASGKPVRVRFRLTARHLPEAQSANVVGEIRGSSRPEEILLLACHLDSWDLGTGALDDASGCGIVIAAAKLLAELPARPARTVRVVLYANEEFGLSGARAYAERHAEELPRHVLAVEADLGAGRILKLAGRVAPEGLPVLREALVDLEPLGVEWLDEPAYGGADLSPLVPHRVPLADLRHDASTYFDYHHTADDTLDKVDPEDLRQCVAAYVVLAWHVASDDRPLGPAPEPPAE